MRAIVMAAVVVCALGASAPAAACHNGVIYEVDPRVGMIGSANAALDADDAATAARRVLRAFPKLRGAALGGDALTSRAIRVMAVAVARLDGVVSDWPSATPEERDANYVWAMRALRGLATRRPNDPATLTDLGEALSRRAATRDEAKKILELLAPRDLITNAHGWAALARVRLATGDVDGRADAVARCAKMAKVIAVCKVRGDAPPVGG